MASATAQKSNSGSSGSSSSSSSSGGWLGWFARPLANDDFTNVVEGVSDADVAASAAAGVASAKKSNKLSGVRVEAATSEEIAALRAQNAQLLQQLQSMINAQHDATCASSSSSSTRSKGPPPLNEMRGLKLHFLPVDMELPQPPAEPSAGGARDFYEKLSASLHLPPPSLPSLKRPNASPATSATTTQFDTKEVEGKSERKYHQQEGEEFSGQTNEADGKRVADDDLDEEMEGRPSRRSPPITGIGAIPSTSTESVIVTAPPAEDESPDGGAVQQVGVVDLANVEWWTMVEKIKDEDEDIYVNVESGDEGETTDINTGDNDDDDENATSAASTLGGTYELVKEEDLCVALADYVALSMARYPQAKQLSSKEMQDMLDATFGQLREQSTAGKLWNWGQFAYTTYGYGSWLYKLYRDPQLVKLVATGVWKAAKWAIVLVL